MIQTTIQNSCAVDGYKRSGNICRSAQCSEFQCAHIILRVFPRTTTVMRAATHLSISKKKHAKESRMKRRARKSHMRSRCTQRCSLLGAGPVLCKLCSVQGVSFALLVVFLLVLMEIETPPPLTFTSEKTELSSQRTMDSHRGN